MGNPIPLSFACHRVVTDDEIHDAAWGARLIYSEVIAGYGGLVWDRQSGSGPDTEETLENFVWPTVDDALKIFRMYEYQLPSSSTGQLVWRVGRTVVVMSPQGSYGYLYVTAVHEKEGHEGETTISEGGNRTPDIRNEQIEKKVEEIEKSIDWYIQNKVDKSFINKEKDNLKVLKRMLEKVEEMVEA